MTYESVSHFAHSWGFAYFAALFAGALLYTFWPRNKAKFDKAARMPLEEDDAQ